MPYATRDQLAARCPSVDMADPAFDKTVAEALKWADKQIDRKLAKRYTVPFDPVPESISQLAADFGQVFVLRSNSEHEPSQAEARKLKEELDKELEEMLVDGVPELVEAQEELQSSDGVAYHSGLGYTSEIAQIDWDR